MELSVVIPCYNEEESLDETYRRVKAACDSAPVESYEVIFINDGSTDKTLSILKNLAQSDSNLVLVDLSRNHGQQLALTAGLFQAKGDYTLILDADLQDPPELLTAMLERARDGVDVVYGQRTRREGETKIKLLTSSLFYKLLSFLSETPIPRDVGDFRLVSRRVLDHFKNMPEQHRFVRGMISWVGFRQEALPYDRDARFAGVTKYSFFKLLHLSLDAISSFSIRPLRISILFAIFGAVLAGFLGLFAIWSYYNHRSVSGWASLATIITFFSSLQLICIGMIGEYIGRTYIEVKNRPLYMIREIYPPEK
jgi:glycosyltransferase involved in cell wall biosynthesis